MHWNAHRPIAAVLFLLLATSSLLSATTAAGPGEPAAEGRSLADDPSVADAIRLLERWIERQLVHRHLPGLAIGVIHDQEVVWTSGFGYSDLASRVPMTSATLFRVGSISKLFTATAVMQLRDAGKLRLDDPVAQHLPWFELARTFEEAPPITLRHLLTHTAGLPREAAFPYWTDHVFPSPDELAAGLRGQPAIYPPAATYKYSNLGMALLGAVVTEVSGTDWADYLEREVFRPLGMASSSGRPTEEQLARRATPYYRRLADGSRRIFDYYDTGAIAPAANVMSSVDDLLRFARLQLRADPAEGTTGGEQILAGSTLAEMHRPHWLSDDWSAGRGLGFSLSRRNGVTVVSHGGWIGGNRTHLLVVPGDKIGVVAAVNADDGSPSWFAYEAYDALRPAIRAATAPEPPPEPIADPAWRRYFGLYADPWGWEYEVTEIGGRLVMISASYPPADDATDGITPLEPQAEAHRFLMPDGEEVVFELGDDGEVVRVRRRYDYLFPARGSSAEGVLGAGGTP